MEKRKDTGNHRRSKIQLCTRLGAVINQRRWRKVFGKYHHSEKRHKDNQGYKQRNRGGKQEGIAKFGGKIPANLKLPLRDGDTDREDDEN